MQPHTNRRHATPAGLILAALIASAAAAADPGNEALRVDGDAKVLPVLNAQSGQIEALLLLEPDASGTAPLDRLFPRSVSLPSLRVRGTTSAGRQVHASLQPDPNAGLALLCNQGVQVAVTLGPLSQQCLLAQISGQDDLLSASVSRPGLVLDTVTRGRRELRALAYLGQPAPIVPGEPPF